MQYGTSASYPVKHFFRVCKDKWKYTESGQTAAHVTSYKNTDLKSSSLAASYLNCSTTFHLFKNVTDLKVKDQNQAREQQIKYSSLCSLYSLTHKKPSLSSPCKKQNWLPQTNTFFLIFYPDGPSFAFP